MQLANQLRELSIQRVVLWGLRTTFNDTFYFIHKGLYETLKKLSIPVIWVDDKQSNADLLREGDLVYAVDRAYIHLPIRFDIKYCLHNIGGEFVDNLDRTQFVTLQVLTIDRFEEGLQNLRPLDGLLRGAASYDPLGNILYQSWGTIWDNDLGQGNIKVIAEYEKLLLEHKIKFKCVKGAPEFFNPTYVRHSAIGASIVGDWQREHGYTPCRLFKAVSYGRIGAINSSNSKIQYPWTMANENIGELIEEILKMSDLNTKELIRFQQKALEKETYEAKIANVCTVLASKV